MLSASLLLNVNGSCLDAVVVTLVVVTLRSVWYAMGKMVVGAPPGVGDFIANRIKVASKASDNTVKLMRKWFELTGVMRRPRAGAKLFGNLRMPSRAKVKETNDPYARDDYYYPAPSYGHYDTLAGQETGVIQRPPPSRAASSRRVKR